jgi:hypothetical protein
MNFDGRLKYTGTLDAVVIRADGSHRDMGRLSAGERLIGRPIQWWRALWASLRRHKVIPVTMGFAAFLATYAVVQQPQTVHALFRDPRVSTLIMSMPLAGLVTTAGANFLAADMIAGLATPRISGMNYHDSGTGSVAAAIGDTVLGTQAGPATRATGTQSNPIAGQYQSVGTINYTGSLAITEWGLFNQAAQGGTLWDRRVFAAINVANGDSIQFTYQLTVTAGGS